MHDVEYAPATAQVRQCPDDSPAHRTDAGTGAAWPASGQPWLSILLPVYNVADFLAECLHSVLRQLEPGIEVLALDDASTDASATILAAFQPRFGSSLRLFRHARNRGLSATRNSLLEKARGDYVWFVDSDDLVSAGAIASLRAAIVAVQPDLLTCDFRVHRERFGLKHRLRGECHRRTYAGAPRRLSENPGALAAGLLMSGQLHAWSKIARRRIWQNVRFPEGRTFEDIAILPALLEGIRSHYHVPEPWLAYRRRQGSILASIDARAIRDQLQSLHELGTHLRAQPGRLNGAARFELDHFVLKSHASLARRLAAGRASAHSDALAALIAESLRSHFPDGTGAVLRAYCRRGWLLRAMRASRALRRIRAPLMEAR